MDPIKVISCIYDSDVYNESSVFHGRTSELKVDPARAMKERNPEVSFFFLVLRMLKKQESEAWKDWGRKKKKKKVHGQVYS